MTDFYANFNINMNATLKHAVQPSLKKEITHFCAKKNNTTIVLISHVD